MSRHSDNSEPYPLLPVLPTSVSGLSACGVKEYVIAEEADALRRMREVRAEVDPLRRELRSLAAEASPEQRQVLEEKIESLRREFQRLRKELKAATRLKMIRLGHIEE
jgi:hypothetical protein